MHIIRTGKCFWLRGYAHCQGLTGKQKQEIIARYLAGESQNKLAKQFGVSHTAISKILKDDKVAKSCQNLKVENYASMSAFLETRRNQTQDIIDIIFNSLKEKIRRATFKECVSAIKDLSRIYLGKEEKQNYQADKEETPVIQFVFEDASINGDENKERIFDAVS